MILTTRFLTRQTVYCLLAEREHLKWLKAAAKEARAMYRLKKTEEELRARHATIE